MTTEKLSQVYFMKKIGNGNNSNFHLGVDYRLFNNRWHIAYPIYSNYNFDLEAFINKANKNYKSLQSFMQRKRIVYVQKEHYKNRQYIVKEIMKYTQVDSYGQDLKNREWPRNISKKNRIRLYREYKFCIAIENSVITWKKGNKYEASNVNDEYVTEKLTDCLLAGSIPIYFGAKKVNYFIPHPNAIINLRDYNSIKELIKYITQINDKKKLIQKHLKWHYNYSKEWFNRFNSQYSFNYCKICNYVKKYRKL